MFSRALFIVGAERSGGAVQTEFESAADTAVRYTAVVSIIIHISSLATVGNRRRFLEK